MIKLNYGNKFYMEEREMDIEIRNPWHPDDAKHYTTDRMRNDYLIQDLFTPD